MSKSYDALVVGAGIGGIRSALDLAETGQKVALIDSKPHLGGLLLQLDRQFPTDNCGMCRMLPLTEREASSQFCMRKGLFHSNIDIYLNTELESLEGDPGAFQAVLRKHSTFVDPTRCIGCGVCATVCPVEVPDQFNAEKGVRAAVHLPVPHSIPNHYVVDLDSCARCWSCFEACPTGAIDFKFEERGSFNILVLDRDNTLTDKLGAWFKKQPFPVKHIQSGTEALDYMTEGGEVQLLMLDLGLEDTDPERVFNRSRELHPRLPVVVTGDASLAEKARQFLDMGAVGFLEKPLDAARTVPWLDKLYMRIVADEIVDIDTAAVILAAGFECYDPSEVGDVLGYGNLPDVLTSVEFERYCSGTGPSKGRLTRISDGKPLRRIAWLQCVGSRDLKKNADYCSSICCMISIKEALMAQEKTAKQEGGPAEVTIFSMDLRLFAKSYQQYADQARERDVRFIRSRIHSAIPCPDPEQGGVRVEYLDDLGQMHEECFDMLVLAVGARPPKGMERLVKATGIETNPWGFCKTMPFEPTRTSRLGVFAAGSFAGAKDIAESLIHSDAAALGASRLINIYAPIREKRPEPEPEYRDVNREPPKVMVALCSSCPKLLDKMNVEAVEDILLREGRVNQVVRVERACTHQGWESIVKAVESSRPNRLSIGACMPYAYIPRLQELGRAVNLNPALMDVVDVASVLLREGQEEKAGTQQEAVSKLRMSVAKLLGADPSPLPPAQPVTPNALVIGGGLAGLTAAHGIADHGYTVHLVEREEQLGGRAMDIRRTLEGEEPAKHMEWLIDQVEKHPNVHVHTNARVALSMGRAGRFMTVIGTDEGSVPVEHGATIIATGAQESKIYDWGFRVHKSVLTHQELEQRLIDGVLDVTGLECVAMIQCWRSREEERDYCSRVCCRQALKNILELKRRKPELSIFVFYRDIMSYGFTESFYTEARRLGAQFIRYEPDNPPRFRMEEGKAVVSCHDPILRRDIEVHADILSLASGLEPEDNAELVELFDIECDEHGFFKEAEPKWRPVDFMKQGAFMCGTARAPGNLEEVIASAKAAAQRAIRVLCEKRLACGSVVAEVRHSLCSLCARCIAVCPYGARSMSPDFQKILVDEVLCQGCGSCAAICPNSASVLRGYKDSQVLTIIDAALEDIGRTLDQPSLEETPGQDV
jgi:heterodisulfide reductase subunit A2